MRVHAGPKIQGGEISINLAPPGGSGGSKRGVKKGPKRGQKGAKKGPKRGSERGPKMAKNGQKVEILRIICPR